MMEHTMGCSSCEAPTRQLWTFGIHPQFNGVGSGEWNTLEECLECAALWVGVPHEPYGSCHFWTPWPADVAAWRRLNAREHALIIHEWHNAVLRENWQLLSPPELKHIEWWRIRTNRSLNAIDRNGERPVRYVENSADLRQFL
jgi:hypothetical protein